MYIYIIYIKKSNFFSLIFYIFYTFTICILKLQAVYFINLQTVFSTWSRFYLIELPLSMKHISHSALYCSAKIIRCIPDKAKEIDLFLDLYPPNVWQVMLHSSNKKVEAEKYLYKQKKRVKKEIIYIYWFLTH